MNNFLDFLRCLLCCFVEDDFDYQTSRGRNRNVFPSSSAAERPVFEVPQNLETSSLLPRPFCDSPCRSSKPPQSTHPQPLSFPKPPTSLSKVKPPPPTSTYIAPFPIISKPQSTSSPFGLSSSFSKPPQASSFSKPAQASSFSKPAQASSSSKPADQASYSKPPQSTPTQPLSPSSPSSSSSKPPQASSFSKPPQASSSSKPPSKPSPSSPNPPPVFKPFLSPASSNVINQEGKENYVWVEKESLPIFTIPEDIKALIKNDIVPKVLNRPLSLTTYKDYFAALLYSEDFYSEKWSDFLLKAVTLELRKAAIHRKQFGQNKNKNSKQEEKTFIAFEIDSVREKRPFLLSRDLVHARPSGGRNDKHFQGIIYRIEKSTRVLVEFEDGFYTHHYSSQKYDVSFSFNRVCLKRAHQAVKDASDALLQNFLFPDCVYRTSIPNAPALHSSCHKLDPHQFSAVSHILSMQGSQPYVVAGPLCVPEGKESAYLKEPSRTGVVVSEAVNQLCQTSLENRILICAPNNSCCDVLMRSLVKKIPESDMFRANAAFREKDEVPDDILPSCLYKESLFSCPPIKQLQKFRVIFSTFMSSFRLHDKGISAGHFSHIFLVDASSAIEPETLIPLTHFAEKNTSVIVTGKNGNSPRWVRADIARQKGLKISYFERLCERRPYRSLDPLFITQLD